jgi:hypothetical protein
MEFKKDPVTGYLVLPDNTIELTDIMDKLIEMFQVTPLGFADRQWIRLNYTAAAEKYNQVTGKKIMLLNINSVIASMNYKAKKGDTLK